MKRKVNSPKKSTRRAERNGSDWQQLYEKMRKERNRLRKELAEVKKKCEAYSNAVGALMAKYEWGEFDEEMEEAVLTQMARGGPSFADLLAEIKARGPR